MSWFKRFKWWVNRDEFLSESQAVFKEIELERQRIQEGKPSPSDVDQLDAFLKELASLQSRVGVGSLPPLHERRLYAAWAVGDSWPFQPPLGHRILDLDAMYKKLT